MNFSSLAVAPDTKVFLAHTTVSITHSVAIWRFSIHETETDALSQEEKSARMAAHKAIVAKLYARTPMDEDAMERRYGCVPGFRVPKSPAPFMSFGGSMAVVTQPVRALLEELGPGALKFFPIEVFAADLKTPIWPDDTFFLMQVLEMRQDCLIAQSTAIRSKTIPLMRARQ